MASKGALSVESALRRPGRAVSLRDIVSGTGLEVGDPGD
jgi:hypothetical protein